MNADALKAAIAAVVSQAAALAIAYGVVDNQHAQLAIALTMGIVNVAFLVVHAWHQQTTAKYPPDPPAPPPPAPEQ